MEKFKESLKQIGVFAIIMTLVYGFLALCNWNYHPMEWNGFSRVLLGIFIFVPIAMFLDGLKK